MKQGFIAVYVYNSKQDFLSIFLSTEHCARAAA